MWGADATQLQMGSGQPFTIKSFFFFSFPFFLKFIFKNPPSPSPGTGKVSGVEEH